MIYLTFDCNIWIYLLDDAWKEYNPLDYLEHWISEQHIQMLLPEIILEEWKKHREEEREKRKRSLQDFFFKAEDLIPVAFIEDQKKPDNIERIVELQFLRIEQMISTAEVIPLNTDIQSHLIDWGVAKKAPLHKKSSVADAVIILSLFDFAEKNNGDRYLFISGNTEDFFSKTTKPISIHPDLLAEFNRLNIKEFHYLKKAVDHLQESLPVTIDIGLIRKERIKQKIADKIHNPVIMQRFEKMEDSYIDNAGLLDVILKKQKPTKSEIILVLGLLEDKKYQQYFYKKVYAPVWFEILKDNSVFSADNNPEPVEVEQGFQIPVWEPMLYLERLSETMPSGANLEFIPAIIEIIQRVSERPKDNFRTWFFLMKVLTNIPNEQIPIEIFDFIPVWLNGRFRTTLESMQLCDKLLPKFLPDQPSQEDINKAEKIFVHLLAIRQNDVIDNGNPLAEREKYSTKTDLHHLKDALTLPNLVDKIAAHYSDITILYLGRQIKHLLLNFPNGIISSFSIENKVYTVNMKIDYSTLRLNIIEKDNNNLLGTYSIQDFEQQTDEQIQEIVTTTIQGVAPRYIPTNDYEDPIVRLKYIIINDIYSTTWSSSIHKMNGRYSGEKPIDIFALILRNILDKIAENNTERIIRLLSEFCNNGHYKMIFFKRLSIYIVGRHWLKLKNFFWQLLNTFKGLSLFSDYSYKKDLFHMLQMNQQFFDSDDKAKLLEILAQGDQSKSEPQDIGHNDYWLLNWYSALKDIAPFDEEYRTMSAKLKLNSDHFEQLGEIRITSGTVSPFDLSDLLKKDNAELAEYILAFKPQRGSEEVSIDGLATALGNAIKESPEKFDNELLLFKDVYYLYAYHIFLGYRDAWKVKKKFNWQKVIEFGIVYINDIRFSKEELIVDGDSWQADSSWVVGALGELISEATHNDLETIDTAILPSIKALLSLLIPKINPINDFTERGMNHPMYVLNSSAGKVLRGLLDYALHVARIGEYKAGELNWEPDIKALFQSAVDRQIKDAFILEGMYFSQFAYLDYAWLVDQLDQNLNRDKQSWLAFMGGFGFADPPNDLKLFYRLYPHYEKALDEELDYSDPYDQGLNKHLVSYFFWGYDTLETDGLLSKFLAIKDAESIGKFVDFIWRQEDYFDALDESGKAKLEEVIMTLWTTVANRFYSPDTEKENNLISGLTRLLMYAHELDTCNTELTIQSIKSVKRQSSNYELIENLVALKDKGTPVKTAVHLADILNTLPFHDFISDKENEEILSLIEFLFLNGQKDNANLICNKLAEQGHEFLNELYKKYNQ